MSFTLYSRSSRHKDSVTLHFFLMSSSFLCIWDRILTMIFTFSLYFHIHVALLTLYRIRNQVYLSTRNRSTLNAILEGFLKTAENLIADLRAHPRLYADPISLQRGVDTQVTTDDPMGIVHKNTANDLREIWRRPSPNTNCWNRKSLHSFCNRERFWTTNCVRLQQTARESERLYDFVVVALQLLCMGATFGTLQASQPFVDGQEDQKAQPSDGHVRLRPLDLTATGPLPEEDASEKDKSHWGQGVKYLAGTLRRHGVHRHKVITMCPPIKNRPHFE